MTQSKASLPEIDSESPPPGANVNLSSDGFLTIRLRYQVLPPHKPMEIAERLAETLSSTFNIPVDITEEGC